MASEQRNNTRAVLLDVFTCVADLGIVNILDIRFVAAKVAMYYYYHCYCYYYHCCYYYYYYYYYYRCSHHHY